MATVIEVHPWSISSDDVAAMVNESFPGLGVRTSGEFYCFVTHSPRLGATIHIQYDRVSVKAGFPTLRDQLIFAILVVGLGIVPPLLVYFLVFHRKMKSFEKEMAACVRDGAAGKGVLGPAPPEER